MNGTIIQPQYDRQEKPMTQNQVVRHRALLAFTLRSWGTKHADIAAIMRLKSKEDSRRHVEKGRRLFIDCVANTVAP